MVKCEIAVSCAKRIIKKVCGSLLTKDFFYNSFYRANARHE
nr:MAG TPA: hypothetical protein [Caudoviricetes sp.]